MYERDSRFKKEVVDRQGSPSSASSRADSASGASTSALQSRVLSLEKDKARLEAKLTKSEQKIAELSRQNGKHTSEKTSVQTELRE